MSSGRNNQMEEDTDLSFEALTFGGGSNNDQLSPSDSPVQKSKENKSKKSSTFRSPVPEPEKEKGTTSVYISTQGENKIDVQSLLKRVELFGTVKAHYFREKQNFGFVQFLDASAVDAVIEDLNRNGVDGVPILAEKAVVNKASGGGGRTSPSSVGGTPFSPSTPMTPSVHGSIGGMMNGGGGGLFSSTPNGTTLFSANNTALLPQVGQEKPDTILVLKNLPFSLKQDQLQEILMQMNSNAPQSINLHFDNLGVFRGMAFIKYRNLDDAIKVYDNLNGYDVGGRKVRVEYKRKNKGPPSDIPQEWVDDEDLKKLWEQVKDFSANPNQHEVSLSHLLTPTQRKQIHAMADKLKLTHFSNGDGEQRHICLKKSASPQPSASLGNNGVSHPMSSVGGSMSGSMNGGTASSSYGHNNNGGLSSSSSSSAHNNNGNGINISNNGTNGGTQYLNVDNNRGIEIKGRRRQNSDAMKSGSPGGAGGGSFTGGSSMDNKYRSGSYSKKNEPSTPTASDNHMDWRSPVSPSNGTTPSQPFTSPSSSFSSSSSSSAALAAAVLAAAVAPVRQPKGPDGSKGFTDLYKESRKSCGSQIASTVVVTPEVSASVST